jgi:hypothetical protein
MSFGSLPSVLGNGGGVAISVIGGKGLFADGTAAAPSISFQSDPDTGLYLDASNTLGIATAGTGTVLFSSSAGIGKIKAHGTRVLALEAGTGNTNITLTPSGTGTVEVISGANSNNGRIQLGTGSFSGYLSNEASSSGALALNSTGSVVFRISGVDKATLLNNGRLLLGTSVDSGALLQIGTNTTNLAGGMIFGTDVGLYRSDNQALGIAHVGGTNPLFHLIEGTTKKFQLGTNAGDVYFDSLTAGKNIYFRSGNQTLALTLDSSQNATFAGTVTVASSTPSLALSGTSGKLLLTDTGVGATSRNWAIGYSQAAEGDLVIKVSTAVGGDPIAGTTALGFDRTGAATFAGAVTVGGALKLANAYVAGAVVGTGYVTIQDSTGTTYRVPVLV